MPRKTLSRLTSILCLLCVAFPVAALALAPPEVIEETNRGAKVILLGQVLAVTPPSSAESYFEMEVTRVIKGLEKVKPGEKIKVRFKPEPVEENGLRRHHTGVILVRVEAGQSIKAYLNPSKTNAKCFEPVLQGSSVIVMPTKGKGPLDE